MAYKGTYAKAIFYRQVLEYRKNRFFIFGWNSVLFLVIGVAIAVVSYYNKISSQPFKMFVIPGVIAYVIFSAVIRRSGRRNWQIHTPI